MRNERRRSRRFPESPERDAAILTHRRHSYDARVLDVSAEGYRLAVKNPPAVEVGEVLGLKTVGGQFAVRVRNVELQPDGTLHIGCERTDDRPASRAQRMGELPRVERDKTITMRRLVRWTTYLFIFVVIFAVVLLMTIGFSGMRKLLQPVLQHLGL